MSSPLLSTLVPPPAISASRRLGTALRRCAGLALLLGSFASAEAQTVMVSNLDLPTWASAGMYLNYMYSTGFTTGSASATLQSISGSFAFVSGALATNTFTLSLYSAAGGLAGTRIETLSGSTSPTTAGIYTYTSAGNVTLAPNTTYFAVASISDPGQARWNVVLDDSQTSNFGWTISDYSYRKLTNGSWGPGSSYSYQISVSALAVPEPSTYAAFAGAFIFAATVYLRRRKIA